MNSKIILGFPGVGKTTLVKAMNAGIRNDLKPTVDLDIKGRKPNSPAVQSALGRLVKTYLEEGLIVFSFMGYFNFDVLPTDTEIIVAHPNPDLKQEWIDRIILRQEEGDFTKELDENWETWLPGWVNAEQKLKRFRRVVRVQIEPDQYLPQVLDDLGIVKLSADAKKYLAEVNGSEDING